MAQLTLKSLFSLVPGFKSPSRTNATPPPAREERYEHSPSPDSARLLSEPGSRIPGIGVFRDAVTEARSLLVSGGGDAAAFNPALIVESLFGATFADQRDPQEFLSLIVKLKALAQNNTIQSILRHKLVGEILSRKHEFETLEKLQGEVQSRAGELKISLLKKAFLLPKLLPLMTKTETLRRFVVHFARLTGLPEGHAAIELFAHLYGLGGVSPENQQILTRFLARLDTIGN